MNVRHSVLAWSRRAERRLGHQPRWASAYGDHGRRTHALPDDQLGAVSPMIGDDMLGDPGELEAAIEQASATIDAYVSGVRILGAGIG